MTTDSHGNWWDREIIRAFNEGRDLPAQIGLPPMPPEVIFRLMHATTVEPRGGEDRETRIALATLRNLMARDRGRETGQLLGDLFLRRDGGAA
jgi:hypothetical protein